MALMSQFDLGKKYTFNTYAPALLGTFPAMQIDGIVDYRTANQYADVAAIHANIFGSLPIGSTANDHRQYHYLLGTVNGSQVVLGLPWIIESSVQGLGYNRAIITIENVRSDELDKIRNALSANGFTVAAVKMEG